MIFSTYSPEGLHTSFGIDMSSIEVGGLETMGVGAAWGRLLPGAMSDAHQHDETETFVIVRGRGDLVMNSTTRPVAPGNVIQFEPFEAHHLHNTGEEELVFATFYWRDPERAETSATRKGRRRFDERPVFVFSSPTTPNGDLHLGHLSGPYLGADVFTRFQRMNGVRVWHVAGSDDFQSYVLGAARREGREPEETAAHWAAEILATHQLMDIGVDQYTVSNQDPGYVEGVQDFYAKVAASDLVSPKEGPALFDPETGRYLYEVDVAGGCPTCGNDTGGNMCEECGEPNFCHDLLDARAQHADVEPQPGTVVRQTLALDRMARDIELHHRLGRVPARVKDLADRLFRREQLDVAITHPSAWGTAPLDGQPEGQVIWVWVDMAYRFLYGIEALGKRLGEDWRADAPQADWKIVHFLGFDNTFYHAVFCPAMYKLAYPEWDPDIDYHLNEFYLLDSSKFSTSRRHALWGKDVLGPGTVDAIRLYLSWTRPEIRRTNFQLSAFDGFVQEVLVGKWQAWLNDLGRRIEKDYGGTAPDAGIWRPEHSGFLAELGVRLSALEVALGQDAFSLNMAAEALLGIVDDAIALSERERFVAGIPSWKDERRTGIALELAAAKLLAAGAAPVMPRFAGRLAAALGMPEPAEWPEGVRLVEPGTRIDLATQVFFGAPAPEPAAATDAAPATGAPASSLLPWLADVVRESLQLPATDEVATRTLLELGMTSMQSIALQYQILEKLGVDVKVEDLLGSRTVGELAAFLETTPAEEVTS
jgi:methionyl-tRNA synthetase